MRNAGPMTVGEVRKSLNTGSRQHSDDGALEQGEGPVGQRGRPSAPLDRVSVTGRRSWARLVRAGSWQGAGRRQPREPTARGGTLFPPLSPPTGRFICPLTPAGPIFKSPLTPGILRLA